MRITSTSPFETKEIGGRLAKNWADLRDKDLPVVYKLEGDLGYGKTALVQGFASGLGVTETITSPSYTYIEEYEFHEKQQIHLLVHLDAWRIEDISIAEGLKIEERYLNATNVLLVEWPNRYPFELWRKSYVEVKVEFEYLSEYARQISFSVDPQHASLIDLS